MGASGKWLKSLVTVKKAPASEHEKQGKKKWRLWRSSSEGSKGGHLADSRPSDSSSDDGFAASMATVVRAPPRDFMIVKKEWAAIRIQTAFRGLLARRALRALRAVVRLQAIFRGRQVRKQAAVTLRCMQALLRVQRRVRARNAGTFPESQAMENIEDEYYYQEADPIKKAEQGWCDSPGTVDDVISKLQMRQDGAIKRERAIAYSLSQQRSRSCGSPWRQTHSSGRSLKNQALENSSPGWSWLDRWMASRQSESILMEETRTDSSEAPCARKSEDNIAAFLSHSYKHDPVKVRKNNVTTRVSAKPSVINISTRSSSAPSSESVYDECSPSTSSTSVSPIPLSSKTLMVDNPVESHNQKPRFMNLTESIKAKQKAITTRHYPDIQNYNMKDQFLVRSMELSNADNRSVAGSIPSSILCRDLYPPVPLTGLGIRNRRY